MFCEKGENLEKGLAGEKLSPQKGDSEKHG